MPTYEYKCESCGYKFEKSQNITEAAVTKCPECGKDSVKRLISRGGGFIFKGSGFYATDYRKGSSKSRDIAPSSCPASNEGCKGCPQNKTE